MGRLAILVLSLLVLTAGSARAGDPARDTILAKLTEEAKAADPAFAGFSAERGQAFFLAKQSGGSAESPSCSSCHTTDPKAAGKTRAGKVIEPMAVSVNPARYTDAEKVAKWFDRNCNTVLGRACAAQEKGDFLTFMIGQ